MIVPVRIDTLSIIETYPSLTKEGVDSMCDNIAKGLAAGYARQLTMEATNALHSTRKAYIDNISVADSGKMEGTVILDYSKNKLVKMLEEGASAFDMKNKMLNSPKAKLSKRGGRYITVPFGQASAGAAADSTGFANVMPLDVYKEAKKLVPTIPTSRGLRSGGLFEKNLPANYATAATRPAINDAAGNVLFEAYKHKSSIYKGIVKTKDGVTGQNSYTSFRRISDEMIAEDGSKTGSAKEAWVHKGIERYNLVQKALSNFQLENELTIGINRELKSMGVI